MTKDGGIFVAGIIVAIILGYIFARYIKTPAFCEEAWAICLKTGDCRVECD